MYLFLVRHFNDIDHLTPVAYGLAEAGERVTVLSVNPRVDVANDVRLRFLQDACGVPCGFVYDHGLPRPVATALSRALCVPAADPEFPPRDLPQRLYESRLRPRLYGMAWARRLLRDLKPRCIVADCGSVTKYAYAPLAAAAREQGIPIVGLPHGMDLMTGPRTGAVDAVRVPGARFAAKHAWLDEIVVQAETVRAKYAAAGIGREHLHVLGSARFCTEWLRVYHDLLPAAAPWPRVAGRARVLYIDHRPTYIDGAAAARAMKAVADTGVADVVVKKTTRGGLSHDGLAACGRIDTDTPTPSLMRQADVVVTTVSSVVLEALHAGVPVVHAAFLHGNRMMWEPHGAAWEADTEEALVAAVTKLAADPDAVPYGAEEVAAFWTEAVSGGKAGAPVLAQYVAFLRGIVERKQRPSAD